MTLDQIEKEINEHLDQIEAEARLSLTHVDIYFIIQLAKEIEELQQKLWEVES